MTNSRRPEIISGNIIKPRHYSINVGGLGIDFQRTCRVPQGKLNSLPAGLGRFPIYKVGDFSCGAPRDWNREGFFMPMYKQEAMWINFSRRNNSPKALIVGAGNINAITGKPFDPSKARLEGPYGRVPRIDPRMCPDEGGLDIKLEDKQNYVVVPPQPWLDGWKARDGKVYQFVAAELGSGETVEGQITGEETVGGVQFILYDSKPGVNLIPENTPNTYVSAGGLEGFHCIEACCGGGLRSAAKSMGLGRGGEIDQKIYDDFHGRNVWNNNPCAVEVVYIVSSDDFKQITGHNAPATPVTYEEYQKQGLPWFELHDKNYKDTPGSDVFGNLKPVSGGDGPNQEDLFSKLKPYNTKGK